MILVLLSILGTDSLVNWQDVSPVDPARVISNPGFLAQQGGFRVGLATTWNSYLMPGPLGFAFPVSWYGLKAALEIGAGFANHRDTAYTLRDDSNKVDSIAQTTRGRIWQARLILAKQLQENTGLGVELLAFAGDFSDSFSSSEGTIYPGDIVVRSRPYAFGLGAGAETRAETWRFGLSLRYRSEFINAARSFDGDSSNGFVLQHTALADTLSGFSQLLVSAQAGLVKPDLMLTGLYADRPGGFITWQASAGRLGFDLTAGYIDAGFGLAGLCFQAGHLNIKLTGGWWDRPRASAVLCYDF